MTVINEYMILNNSSKRDQPMSVTNVCVCTGFRQEHLINGSFRSLTWRSCSICEKSRPYMDQSSKLVKPRTNLPNLRFLKLGMPRSVG
jgi:hypothetical protein